jgi:uncharacterized protein (TIGR03084 family)
MGTVDILAEYSHLCSPFVDSVVTALAEQQAELASLLAGVTEVQWNSFTRCEGWRVSDVVLHVAQSDEMAIASLTGRLPAGDGDGARGWGGGASVDESVALMVEQERGAPLDECVARWTSSADGLVAVLDAMDLSTRVRWVVGDLSARSLATTRLAETWIHAGDVAAALDRALEPTDRLRLVARLAWRTLPYAFASAGKTMRGPVAFRLVSPSGERWEFQPDEPAVTTIEGAATELCAVAARRRDPLETSLHGTGPDTANVLDLVRTYA